jgi:hypothetical protein
VAFQGAPQLREISILRDEDRGGETGRHEDRVVSCSGQAQVAHLDARLAKFISNPARESGG